MLKSVRKALVGATLSLVLCGLFGVNAFAEDQTGTVTADLLNVRQSPSTSATLITQLSRDAQVIVLESADGWYKVSVGEVSGWVNGQYLSVSSGSPKATITGDVVNVRTGPSKSNDIIVAVIGGEKVSVLGSSDGWYNVEFSSGLTGWIYGDYISTGTKVSRGDSLGTQIVTFAKKYLGTPYVYGGSSQYGVDCSGFVKLVYNSFQINVNRVAADQASQGTAVSTSSLKEGDLVFFDTDGGGNYINHVGIYIGGGQFIHASSGSGKVVINSIWDSFYSRSFMTARTLLR